MTMPPVDLAALVGVPLSDEQMAAATAPLEPGLIVAGAGTGKTTVMAARVVWLAAAGLVRPEQVLGLTFTTKAAGELVLRIRRALAAAGLAPSAGGPAAGGLAAGGLAAPAGDDPAVSTYHAFAGRLIAEFGVLIGMEPGARLLSEVGRIQLAHRLAVASNPPAQVLAPSPYAVAARVVRLDGALADSAVEPAALLAADAATMGALVGSSIQKTGRDMLDTARLRHWLTGLVQQFRAAKADLQVVDFADQVRLAQVLAEQRPDVVADLRSRFMVVLLDEYQDTSVAQRRMLQALFGGGHPVTAVGDPCQAIYGWRGASSSNMDAFPLHFRAGGADGPRPAGIHRLQTNRRSERVILHCGNAVAEPLRQVHTSVGELRPAPSAGAGLLEVGLLETTDAERDWIVARIEQLGRDEGIAWDDIAILARSNDVIGTLSRALAERAIPVQVLARSALLDMPEVVDVVSALAVVDDPADDVALLRLLTGPRCRLGVRDLAVLSRRVEDLRRADEADLGISAGPTGDGVAELHRAVTLSRVRGGLRTIWDAVADPGPRAADLSPAAAQRVAQMHRLVVRWQRHAALPVPDLIALVGGDLGVAVEVRLAADSDAADAGLRALTDLARSFSTTGGRGTLTAFMAHLADARRLDVDIEGPVQRRPGAVTLMTVHGAKGLEFPVVFLPGMAHGSFPSARGRPRWPTSAAALPFALVDDPVDPAAASFPADPGDPRHKEHQAFADACRAMDLREETRLAYVAVTRAERHLVATGYRWSATRSKPVAPGPFLTALRDAAEQAGCAPFAWAPEPPDGAVNPLGAVRPDPPPWPAEPIDPVRAEQRRTAAGLVRSAMLESSDCGAPGAVPGGVDDGLSADEAAEVARWDRDLALILADIERPVPTREVDLPSELSVSALSRLHSDPDGFALDLARPVPRVAGFAARAGTRFHEWVQSLSGQRALWDIDELPGAADPPIADPPLELRRAFLDSPYGGRAALAVEQPFELAVDGRRLRGRIDAVFADGAGWEVVDWKTGSRSGADPLQLAVYRLAWAQHVGADPALVRATFVFPAQRRWLTYPSLPGSDELAAILAGSGGPGIPAAVVGGWSTS